MSIWRHISRCLIAGIVALLPIAGILLAAAYLEFTIARFWPAQTFYVPGLGIVAAFVILYLIGLVVSTFLGRFLWRQIDAILRHLPVMGLLYTTLKQILGYGEGPGALFERVVLVPSREIGAWELGLVTNHLQKDGVQQLIVFVPGSPNPLTGRLIVIDAATTQPLQMSVNEAMRALVAVGKAGTQNISAPADEQQ